MRVLKKSGVTRLDALRAMKESISQVNKAVREIEKFAVENSLDHIIDNAGKISLSEFAGLVAEDIGVDEETVSNILEYALGIVRDLELSIYEDEEDDDE